MASIPIYVIARGSRFYYRRRIPEDIQRLGGFGGESVYQIALKTSDVSVARRKSVETNEWFEAECNRLRGTGLTSPLTTAIPEPLTDGFLIELRDHRIALALKAEEEFRVAMAGDPDLQEQNEREINAVAKVYSADAQGQIIDQEAWEAKHAAKLEKVFAENSAISLEVYARALNIAKDSPDYRRLELVLIDAEARIHASKSALKPGQLYRDEYDPAKIKPDLLKSREVWTLERLAEAYKDTEKPNASWAHKIDVAVTMFHQFMGKSVNVRDIVRSNVKGFVELMLKVPQNAQKRFPGRTVIEAIAANERLQPRPYPVNSPNTIKNNYLAPLRALLGFAVERLEIIESDPTLKVKVAGSKKISSKSTMFEIEELNALFKLPVFIGCKDAKDTLQPGPVKLNDHQFWVPLIMLFTGARPSEIAQLAVTDIKLGSNDKSIDFLTEYDESDPLDRPYVRTFKSANARRRVPINRVLIELGFEDFVQAAKVIDWVRRKVEVLRPKLLDLSRRNPLISVSFSPKSSSLIRVVDELPDVLFYKLNNYQKMRVVPLPDLEEDPKDEEENTLIRCAKHSQRRISKR